jgi:hypothetical protein
MPFRKNHTKISTISLEFQAYPAGLITQLRTGFQVSPKSELLGSLGSKLLLATRSISTQKEKR